MVVAGRRKSIAFFIALGVGLISVTLLLYVGWVLLNWRTGILLFLGVLLLALIISGVVINTVFLVREIRRNEQHDAFINAVTHELKTPIASIRLYLQTLQRRDVDESKRQEFYRLMLDDTNRLLGTVEQVLKAGEAGVKRRQHTRLDFAELVRSCVEVARTGHHLQPEALRYDLRSERQRGMAVSGDSEELSTAVSNLLDNAIKYSGEKIDIVVGVEIPDERRVILKVQDHGVGIPAAELKRIFKRFYRVRTRSLAHVKGTGLGLFIVRAVAKKHGGRVFAESAGEGHGTTVVFELPRSKP